MKGRHKRIVAIKMGVKSDFMPLGQDDVPQKPRPTDGKISGYPIYANLRALDIVFVAARRANIEESFRFLIAGRRWV